jgi:hypothetical protein
MDDWITCPHCGLKHRPRAVTLCPRCGRTSAASSAPRAVVTTLPSSPVVRPAPAGVSVPTVTPPPAPAVERVPTVEYIPPLPAQAEQRAPAQAAPAGDNTLPLAGGILLLNAVLHLFEFLFLPSVSMEASLRAAQLAGTLVGTGIDVFLGVSFLLGKGQYRTFAFIRLVVGMFLFGGMSLYQAQYLFTLVVVAFSCGLLVLVWGKPSSFLASVGLAAEEHGGAVEVLGFIRLAATQPLTDRARIALRPDLEGRRHLGEETLVGDRHAYKLQVPSDGWYRRRVEVARTSDSSIDVWLAQPDARGHLLVTVRRWSEADAEDLREARNLELRNLKAQYPGFQVTDTSDNGTRLEDPTVASFSGSADRDGEPHHFESALYRVGDKLLQVTAYAPAQAFETLRLRGATAGFRPN